MNERLLTDKEKLVDFIERSMTMGGEYGLDYSREYAEGIASDLIGAGFVTLEALTKADEAGLVEPPNEPPSLCESLPQACKDWYYSGFKSGTRKQQEADDIVLENHNKMMGKLQDFEVAAAVKANNLNWAEWLDTQMLGDDVVIEKDALEARLSDQKGYA